MKNTVMALVLLASLSTSYGAGVTLDGIMSPGDNYTSETTTWYNGHNPAISKPTSSPGNSTIYGDFGNQLGTTRIYSKVAELDGGTPGEMFFFLYLEAPLAVKNMIWEDPKEIWGDSSHQLLNTDPNTGLVEADVTSYRTHHETHHPEGDMKLDFKGATGSEQLFLVDSNGDHQFNANLNGGAESKFGLVSDGYKDSVDYLLFEPSGTGSSISTATLSLARDTPMSFEFQFKHDPTDNDAILALARNGIEFHLSPERGLPLDPEGPPLMATPEPSTAMLGVIGLIMILIRRTK